ncbi:cupin domain-containing protein [Gordonia sp. NPDC003429]
MDAVAGLLYGARADGAFMIRSVFSPPWSFRICDEAPLAVAVCVSGAAWVVPDDSPPVHLHPGDVAVFRGPDPYTVAADPSIAPTVFIQPGQHCVDAFGNSMAPEMVFESSSRSWGNDQTGKDVLVTGTYESSSAVSERLLRALPSLLVLRGDEWSSNLVAVLCEEVQRDTPGQEVFLDRLLDLVVLGVIRAWLEHGATAPAWYRAALDDVVGVALRAVHERPAHPWTVASLAAEAGVSRAAFARRFVTLVGETPMEYVTSWRLAVAADLLTRTDDTLARIARLVGYSSPFALSAAFSRVRGVSPAAHRKASRPTLLARA